MRRILLFAAVMLAAIQVLASPVDMRTAQAKAQAFVQQKLYSGKMMAPISGEMKLAHAEINSQKLDRAVYYIFNSQNGYVIVSGDDRAEEILGYGDAPLDINAIPDNMKAWLATYKVQLEYLQANEGLVVEAPSLNAPARIASVEPLLTALWDQEAPYWNQCKINNVQCLTGCPATSAAMVFHFWKYPDYETPTVPGYKCELSTGYYTSSYVNVAPLPPVNFDWDNMLDRYTNGYTTEQANAVATLMRYIGQAERMDYSPQGSGAQGEDILRAAKFFGYDEEAEVVYKATADYYGNETQLIDDATWAELVLTELNEGRPLVYCAYDYDSWAGWSGHAFNVDGYNATDNTYHVNWGWSGEGNGYYALNAFSYGDYTFNVEQLIIKGLQPPITTPTIRVSPIQLNMQAFAEHTDVATFTVKGKYLTGDVTLTLNDDSGVFTLDAGSVALAETTDGRDVTVTYAPQFSGHHTATVTLSSPQAADVTITITGAATLQTFDPVMQPADSAYITSTGFRADWTDLTAVRYIDSYTLEVNTKPGATLLDEVDWSDVTEMGTNYADNPAAILPQGWTFIGNGLWRETGGISINNKSALATPTHDLAGYEKVTAIVTAKSVLSSSNSRFTVATSIDTVEFKAPAGADFERFVAVLDCEEIDQVTIAGKSNYPLFQSIQVYAGELDEPMVRAIVEQGDANYRLITGLTDKNYLVTDLTAGGTFYYRVKATYIDGTQSAWSKSKNVTLFGDGQPYQPGDVDHDGSVNIADVTALIDYLLSDTSAAPAEADVDDDGAITIADVTALIDILLSAH